MNIKSSSLKSVPFLPYGYYEVVLITIVIIVIGFEAWRIYLLLKLKRQQRKSDYKDTEHLPEVSSPPKPYDFESDTSELLYDTSVDVCNYNNKRKSFFDLCHDTIERHIKEVDYNAKILAEDLNIDRSHLYKKLKRYTDMSPLELIEQVRIENAISLLENSEMQVEFIVKECGFKDYKSMKSLFMKHLSKMPEEFRVKEDNESDLQDESQSNQLL